MAKSARASTRKANNRRLAKNVFGPAEDARRERLSAKLMELAKQSKPDVVDVKMIIDGDAPKEHVQDEVQKDLDGAAMDVDSSARPSSGRINKKRIDKRKQRKTSKIVFKTYRDRGVGNKKRNGK